MFPSEETFCSDTHEPPLMHMQDQLKDNAYLLREG